MKPIIIITGDYGVGKTECALALTLQSDAPQRTIVDLDIVSPYYRTADASDVLARHNVRLIAPLFARTNVDIPALTADVDGALLHDDSVLLDVGGDDGALALGRYNKYIVGRGYVLYCVINAMRPYASMGTEHDDPVADMLDEIRALERHSRLTVTALINNTHLMGDTSPDIVRRGMDYAAAVSEASGLPVAYTAVRREYATLVGDLPTLIIGERHMRNSFDM